MSVHQYISIWFTCPCNAWIQLRPQRWRCIFCRMCCAYLQVLSIQIGSRSCFKDNLAIRVVLIRLGDGKGNRCLAESARSQRTESAAIPVTVSVLQRLTELPVTPGDRYLWHVCVGATQSCQSQLPWLRGRSGLTFAQFLPHICITGNSLFWDGLMAHRAAISFSTPWKHHRWLISVR